AALVIGTAVSVWKYLAEREARNDADQQRQAAVTNADEANRQRQLAVANAAEAVRQTQQTNLALADMAVDRGLVLCEQGEVGLGMLWLFRSLEMAPPDATDLQRVIRANLGAWQRRLPNLKLLIPHTLGGGHAVALSPDGRTILTGGHDKMARL